MAEVSEELYAAFAQFPATILTEEEKNERITDYRMRGFIPQSDYHIAVPSTSQETEITQPPTPSVKPIRPRVTIAGEQEKTIFGHGATLIAIMLELRLQYEDGFVPRDEILKELYRLFPDIPETKRVKHFHQLKSGLKYRYGVNIADPTTSDETHGKRGCYSGVYELHDPEKYFVHQEGVKKTIEPQLSRLSTALNKTQTETRAIINKYTIKYPELLEEKTWITTREMPTPTGQDIISKIIEEELEHSLSS